MKLLRIFSDDLIRDSGIIFAASTLGNVFNLIFWLFMVRALNPADYGALNSLIGLLMVISIPAGAIQVGLTRFVAEFQARDKLHILKEFLFRFGKRVFLLNLVLLVFIIVVQKHLGLYLKLSDGRPLIVLALIIFITAFSPLTMAVLQGLQHFGHLAINTIVSGLAKLLLGIVFVSLGFGVIGALLGFFFASFFGFILSIFQIPRIVWQERLDNPASVDFRSFYKYLFPVGLTSFAFVILTNTDIILVKHYFSPLEAGYYSISQIIGKIILFLPGAITTVMFPKVSSLNSSNKPTMPILKKSLFFVSSATLCGVIIAVLFPEKILKLLTANVYPACIPLARLFAISMGIFCLVTIFINYHLSLNNLKFILIVTLFSLLQILLISLFHQSLQMVLYILLSVYLCLFLLGFKEARFKKNNLSNLNAYA